MEKKKILWIIMDLVFLVIFNAFFFILGGSEHNASVWLSYGFIHFAYLMVVITPFLVKGSNVATTGFPLYTISSAYFLLELIAGVVFILVSPDSIKAALLVQLCIAGLYIVILVVNMLANEQTTEAEESRQMEVTYIKNASNVVKGILSAVENREVKRAVEKLADELSSSPTKSHPNLQSLESEICYNIDLLNDNLKNKNLSIQMVDKIIAMVKDRNRQLKAIQ
jgi:hypothetical protein